MSVHFEKLRVKNIKKETADCVSIIFDIPETLRETFRFKQGQHLTMRSFMNGQEMRRSYSLCSSPLENEWKIAVKKTGGGLFSTFINEQLKIGDTIEVMPPMGHFYTELNPANKKKYVAFAAGSGITPVISVIKTILAIEQQSSVVLVYGNRNRSSIIFLDELEALKNKYMQRFSITYILSREMTDAEINYGRIDGAKCLLLFSKIIDINADEFFICGPQDMILAVKNFLLSKDVDEKKIHFELFLNANQTITKPKAPLAAADKDASKVFVKLDGITFHFALASNDESILDAALFNGIDAPYSCKGGMCCTCKAKLLEGEVTMDVHYGLEPEEIANGYILTCQSHPETKKVVIDFDIK